MEDLDSPRNEASHYMQPVSMQTQDISLFLCYYKKYFTMTSMFSLKLYAWLFYWNNASKWSWPCLFHTSTFCFINNSCPPVSVTLLFLCIIKSWSSYLYKDIAMCIEFRFMQINVWKLLTFNPSLMISNKSVLKEGLSWW
mgnify:CR=1 FL=1